MGLKKIKIFPNDIFSAILKQAEKEYPFECCGMLLKSKQDGKRLRLRVCENVQNKYHKQDPLNFPRTAATAYFIDPKELLAIQKETREKQEEIDLIYHSHINAGAYFSEEDKRVATCEGDPAYPGVRYLVVSVKEGKAADWNLFVWDNKRKDFINDEDLI